MDLLRQVQEQELPEEMDVSCNMVSITPVDGGTSESLAVLRSGKATAEEKGKGPAKPNDNKGDPKPPPPPNKLNEEMKKLPKPVEYDVIAHLRRIPARLSIYEARQLSKESREALINALVNESVRDFDLAESTDVAECAQTITFTDEDLLLGDYEHNRPLFVTGDLAGERIKSILLDAGSAVNILPLKTLKRIGLTPAQLRASNLMIQGFNQRGQRTIGVITLDLDIQGFLTQVNCHVINAPTSYNLLLGRPWLHRYKVVASTAHQCFDVLSEWRVKARRGKSEGK